MTDKELMQEVLAALESLHRTGDTQVFDMCAAPVLIPALRERLAQPDREWVGLTDDDLRQIILVAVGVAEAKLKEKNT